MISNTIANEDEILESVSEEPLNEDVICASPLLLIKPSMFLTIVGASELPLWSILITVPNDALILFLSTIDASVIDVYWDPVVTFMFWDVFSVFSNSPLVGTYTNDCSDDNGKLSTILITPLAETLFGFT